MTPIEHEFSVPEISCGHCKQAIEGSLTGVAGVTDIHVDIGARMVRVSGGDRDAIVSAIDDAGFDVSP